ncbi:hypothetical protein MMC14_005320 [Varicellaria rhodocarpa]|nr:hypothetical protein [Varicellaria rhodocarpa]
MEIVRYGPPEYLRPHIPLNQVIPATPVDEWVIPETPPRDPISRHWVERFYELEETVLETPISSPPPPLSRQNAISHVIYRERIRIHTLANEAGFTRRTVSRIVRRDRIIVDRVLRLPTTPRLLRRRGHYTINTLIRYYVLEFMLERQHRFENYDDIYHQTGFSASRRVL